MSEASLRASIKTLLSTVPGSGTVHDYERWTKDMAQFLTLFKQPDGRILGWEIVWAGIKSVECKGRGHKVTHIYQLRGYYGLRDSAASDKSFAAIVWAVFRTFLTRKVEGAAMATHPESLTIEPRMFGTVLCHYAQIDLPVPEIVEDLSEEEIVDLLRIGLNYYLQPEHPTTGDKVDATDVVTLR